MTTHRTELPRDLAPFMASGELVRFPPVGCTDSRRTYNVEEAVRILGSRKALFDTATGASTRRYVALRDICFYLALLCFGIFGHVPSQPASAILALAAVVSLGAAGGMRLRLQTILEEATDTARKHGERIPPPDDTRPLAAAAAHLDKSALSREG